MKSRSRGLELQQLLRRMIKVRFCTCRYLSVLTCTLFIHTISCTANFFSHLDIYQKNLDTKYCLDLVTSKRDRMRVRLRGSVNMAGKKPDVQFLRWLATKRHRSEI